MDAAIFDLLQLALRLESTLSTCHSMLQYTQQLTLSCRYSVAIMMDTEGSEVHLNELSQPQKAEVCLPSMRLS